MALLTCIAMVVVPASAPAASKVNKDPRFLQVYDDNVENLETPAEQKCPGDWRNLIAYMRAQALSPDLFIVQQVSDRAQLDRLIHYMNKHLAGRYRGVIAKRHPAPFRSPCGAPKARQTNAVIYRSGRLHYTRRTRVTWRSDSSIDRAGGTCGNDARDRSINVAIPLYDERARKPIVVGSFHWPTKSRQGRRCATENARELALRMGRTADAKSGVKARLRIAGGDANALETSDGGRWLQQLNLARGGKYGYADAAYSACAGHGSCLGQQWTIKGSRQRIDYLFARLIGGKTVPPIAAFTTIPFAAAGARKYSDHRALTARIFY